MIRKHHFGLVALSSAALLLSATSAFAQDNCEDDFVVPTPAEDLCDGLSDDDIQSLSDDAAKALDAASDDVTAATCDLADLAELDADCAYCFVAYADCNGDDCDEQLDTCIDGDDDNGDDDDDNGDDNGDDDDDNGDDDNGDDDNGDDDNGDDDNGDDDNGSGEVDDPYGETCSGGPDCKDGEWDVSQTGGRVGSSCASGLGGAGGGITALLLGLGLVAQRRRRK